MSNSLVLEHLNNLSNQPAKKLKKPPKKKKKLEWWQILLNVFLGVVSMAVEMVATAILGPVGGMVVGVIADVTTNVASDIVSGQNPFDIQNLMFNVILPVASIGTKVFTVSKMNKNAINTLSEFTKKEKLNKLAKRLNKIDFEDLTTNERMYSKILKDVGLTKNDLTDFDIPNLKGIKFLDDLQQKEFDKFNDLNFFLRWGQRGLSIIDDPNYAQKVLFKFITKHTPLKKAIDKINKPLRKLKKTINTKFFKNTHKKLSKILIQFNNHTVAPWIRGIKLYPIKGAINYYHVSIHFDPSLTNNKKEVCLYNKSWRLIYEWLNAPSCGQYYINRISWGWDIGSMIRKSANILGNFNVRFIKSQKYQTLYLTTQYITKFASIVNKAINNELVSEFKEKYSINNIAHNFIYSAGGELTMGGNLIKKGLRTFETGDIRYFNKFIKHKVKKTVEKKVKNKIIKFKNGSGEKIGYGKYKYKLS